MSQSEKDQLIDTINQSFELLRLNYHHLYFSAYSEIDALNSAKRLWMENLSPFKPDVILKTVHLLIKESDYLPTISRVIRGCLEVDNTHSLPDVHSAYIEACRAPSPKRNAPWSHPAVYYAGQQSNWYFLANNTEATAFPIFKTHYETLYQRVLNGEALPEITPLALPDQKTQALSKEENITQLQKMRTELGI
ncbi:hypothetical protein AB835_04975 [Candidatus Endobugula sertula]|uniref:Replicative helicase inhibitor G39P N-terminal domain-containing protein n=1 Tax=Candidatus Endobugula sertula TaxID=62101 RepID=A0A1D2QRL5_9GAMM|nr:hypothetical protein AB835_04975 [Candidatus Endobugula sertula]